MIATYNKLVIIHAFTLFIFFSTAIDAFALPEDKIMSQNKIDTTFTPKLSRQILRWNVRVSFINLLAAKFPEEKCSRDTPFKSSKHRRSLHKFKGMLSSKKSSFRLTFPEVLKNQIGIHKQFSVRNVMQLL